MILNVRKNILLAIVMLCLLEKNIALIILVFISNLHAKSYNE